MRFSTAADTSLGLEDDLEEGLQEGCLKLGISLGVPAGNLLGVEDKMIFVPILSFAVLVHLLLTWA